VDKPPAPLRRIRVILTALLIKAYAALHPERCRFAGFVVATPRGCLPPRYTVSTSLLARAVDDMDLVGRRVLDVGCGSGALMLVASRRGAYVVGVDIDPVCARAARVNLEANGLGAAGDIVVCDSAECLRGGFDLAVVNPPFLPVEGEPYYACGRGCSAARRMLSAAAHLARRVLYAWSSLSGDPPLGCMVVASRRGLLDRVYACLHDGSSGARRGCGWEAEAEHVAEYGGGLPPGE